MTINKKHFILILLAMFIYILPLLNSPYYYMDDNVRVVTGHPDWGWQGRPVADFVYYILSFSFVKIKDFFPYSLLLGLFFVSFVFKSLFVEFCSEKKVKLAYVLSFLFIIMNPFFMQNLSYRYDSLPMILGLISSIYAFLILRINIHNFIKISYSIVFLIISLSLYQPCVNAFLVMSFYSMILLNYKNHNEYFKELSKKLLIFMVAFVGYDIIVLKLLSYSTSRSTFIGVNEIDCVFLKLKVFFSCLMFQLPSSISILFMGVLLYTFYIMLKDSNNKKLTLISLLGMFLSLWGGLLLIKENMSLPREFPVFGLYFTLHVWYILNKNPGRKIFCSIVIFVLLILNTAYFYHYINMYKTQSLYESNIEDSLVLKINSDKNLSVLPVYINGKPDYEEKIKNTINSSDLFIRKMLLTSDEWISRYALYRKGLKTVNLSFKSGDVMLFNKLMNDKTPPYYKNSFYSIYVVNNKVEVFILREGKLYL